MTTILIFTAGMCLIALLWSRLILYRNDKVLEHRKAVIGLIALKASEDLRAGRPWEWRFDDFEKVSYREMVYKIWKPVGSFYRDKDCVK